MPVFAFSITGDEPSTEYDLSDRLRSKGWQVPAYTMPDDASDVVVLRIVLREGFTRDLGRDLWRDVVEAVTHLRKNPPLESAVGGFNHG